MAQITSEVLYQLAEQLLVIRDQLPAMLVRGWKRLSCRSTMRLLTVPIAKVVIAHQLSLAPARSRSFLTCARTSGADIFSCMRMGRWSHVQE